jgi:hypothetical protein
MVLVQEADLRAMIADEMRKVVRSELSSAGERIGLDGMAARYNVSKRTICNWLKEPGKLPPRRAGQQWLLRDVHDWEKHTQVQNISQQTS